MKSKKLLPLVIATSLLGSCGSKQNQTDTTGSLFNQEATTENEERVRYSQDILSPAIFPQDRQVLALKAERLSVLDKEFFEVMTVRDPEITQHNEVHYKNGTRHITIEGKRILLDSLDQQHLVKLLNGQRDIAKVTINCERLDIETPVVIPGADLEINAQELVLTQNGSIDLTPHSNLQRAPQFEEGAQGAKGSTLTLNISNLQAVPRTTPLFIVNGANGQPAGLGQAGSDGNSLPDLGGGVIREESVSAIACSGTMPKSMQGCSEAVTIRGSGSVPSKGEDARQGGKPGLPGDGGVIRTTIPLAYSSYEIKPGLPGTPAPLYKGGKPGLPNPYYIITSKRKSHAHYVSPGLDAASPILPKDIGNFGRIEIIKEGKWLTPAFLKYTSKYARHLHKVNSIEEAKVLTEKVVAKCVDAQKTLTTQETLLCAETTKSLTPLLSNLDYYGKKASWIPSFSVEANYRLFQDELERSFRTLFLTYWTQKETLSIEQRNEALNRQSDLLTKTIARKEKEFNELNNSIPQLNTEIANLKKEEFFFEKEVHRIEREILASARSNVRERSRIPLYKKALKTVAALSRVIPAGQPSLGAAATTIETIVESFESDEPLKNIFEKLPAQLSSLTPAKVQSSFDNWKKVKQSIDYNEYKRVFSLTPENSQLNSSEIKKEKNLYIERLKDFTSPIAKEALNQLKLYKRQQVSKADIEKEVLNIKKAHPLFKKLSGDLLKLVNKRQRVAEQLTDVHNRLNDITSTLQSSFLQMAALSEATAQLSTVRDHDLNKTLKEIEEEQLERLDYYYYLFQKAYSYRMLRPFPGLITTRETIEKIKKLASQSEEGELSLEELLSLKEVYTAQISRVIEEMINDFDLQYRNSKVFKLSEEQIEALNDGHEITLDLTLPRYFGHLKNEENLRINGIKVLEMNQRNSNDSESKLLFSTTGESLMKKNGLTYFFSLGQKPFFWGAKAQSSMGSNLEQIRPSPNNQSLLRSFLSSAQDGLLFSRPGALTHLKVKFSHFQKKENAPKLDAVAFEIDYDYSLI